MCKKLMTYIFLAGGRCLDVSFEEPASGFFLRETTAAISSSSSTPSLASEVAPTTSIILGASDIKAKGPASLPSSETPLPTSKAFLLGDILHRER